MPIVTPGAPASVAGRPGRAPRGPGRRLRDRLVVAAAARLGLPALRALGNSLRIEVRGEEHLARARALGSGRVLYTMWHSHMLFGAYHHRDRGIRVLVSQHHDGEIIARIVEGMGFGTVRGSTTRGGRDAFYRMVMAARDGHDIAITPDGPRGPREVVAEGVVRLAQWSGVPILVFAAGGPRDWTLDSWDRFRIPRPWSRVRIIYTPPILVPRNLAPGDVERYRLLVQAHLDAGFAEALRP